MKKKFTLFTVLFFLFANVYVAAYSQAVNVQDSLALVDLYNGTHGANWKRNTNWLAAPVAQWFGITVSNGRVVRINLLSNGLNGSIPSSIGNITALQTLNLIANNKLDSALPASLGNLANLDSLNLSLNALTGTIPVELSNLSKIKYLDLGANKLTGNIPTQLGNLTSLGTLTLQDNQLSGAIPAELGNLSNLSNLNLIDNLLTGSIPAALGNLQNLSGLFLSHNQLTGSIPNTLGNLTNLSSLYLDFNQLTESIPAELGNLTNLFILVLSDNNLSGKIPPQIGALTNMVTLELMNNQLSGKIPAQFSNLVNLQSIDLSNNKLSGNISSGIGNLSNLAYITLDNNKFTGDISPFLMDNSFIKNISANHNKLSGKISSSIADQEFSTLEVSYNAYNFDAAEIIAEKIPFALYKNQAIIHINQHGNTLAVSVGGTLSNNVYRWSKVGETGNTKITGDSVFHPSASGTYSVQVKNLVARELALRSDTFNYTAPGEIAAGITANNTQAQTGKTNAFTVYPNPAKDVLHIQTTGSASFSLTNEAGHIILTKNINGNGSVNVSGFAAGVYYLKNNNSGAVQKVAVIR